MPSGNTQPPDDNLPLEEAVFRPSRWPGLIWALPVAALIIILWLGIGALLSSGPSVTVTFPVTGGLGAGSTPVKYKGFTVGHVEAIKLSKSLNQLSVKIRFVKEMEGHLGKGTEYWIAGTNLSITNLSEIKDLISGPVIAIAPQNGPIVRHATGMASPPVPAFTPPGEHLILSTRKLEHLSTGSPINYNGFKVGEVSSIILAPNGSHFEIGAFIQQKWAHLITSSTRFWGEGAIQLTPSGSGAAVQFASVPALLSGAIAFTTPDGVPSRGVKDGAQFPLYSSRQTALDAPGEGAVAYRVVFPGGPHGLAARAPVQLEGAAVGSVTHVNVRFDPSKQRLETDVTLMLEPELIGRAGTGWDLQTPRPQMDAMLSTLIKQGLRAQLGRGMPVVGGKMIKLSLVPNAPTATLQPGTPPLIPSMPGSGGVSTAITRINAILAQLDALPLSQIAGNVQQVSAQLAHLSTTPQTRQTLQRLDETVAHINDITQQTKAQLPTILHDVKRTTAEAEAALASLQGLASANGPVNAGPESTGLAHALYEISEAAKSLRALTDFLNSHPNALLAGREN
ncbi:PqiB family protein [Acidocella aminolytica]|uniref:Mce/MlaD domain-containing protein n=1 Tax=Acidocella aminolytica 101 = DSM 11237 TaxID=1120923 RepID=A0A0D6PH74_9PROT|nr:MlaD family protein [Acidocella aminolytica]GAN81027.1 hypothetical protein Aam_070_029 [Acidocella aminolytica 101 = DSM 11237]GBQ38486.1 hypothetical protein AA11237_1814 [Acidocella aminolytica 101 = DSM 11237]SHE89126.1 paraquat-inducible protein B [Acidocella aminolytica 101 = DSM 11237]